MIKRFIFFLMAITIVLSFVFVSLSHARPPKPGPNFVWVSPHTRPNGTVVPGYWKYVGPAKEGKEWVPGHYNANGVWVPGYWKATPGNKPGRVWVPGHHGPRGRWIPGHWR